MERKRTKEIYRRWRPTSDLLMDKYVRRQQGNMFSRLGGYKRSRSPSYGQDVEATHRYPYEWAQDDVLASPTARQSRSTLRSGPAC
jgi:hypothetical protein